MRAAPESSTTLTMRHAVVRQGASFQPLTYDNAIDAARRVQLHCREDIAMGLLDGLLGNMMGRMPGIGQENEQGFSPQGNAQPGNPLLAIALQLLAQNGGLQAVLGKLTQAGVGQQAQSWIGTGQNQPINADVLTQIFGGGQLGDLARQHGMSEQEAAGGLAQMLPNVVDEMTPQGHIPDDHNDLVSRALEILNQKR